METIKTPVTGAYLHELPKYKKSRMEGSVFERTRSSGSSKGTSSQKSNDSNMAKQKKAVETLKAGAKVVGALKVAAKRKVGLHAMTRVARLHATLHIRNGNLHDRGSRAWR
jgi:hypothetical protein